MKMTIYELKRECINCAIKILDTYHFPRRPVTLVLCILLVLLTALSYSDFVKSWRGECGGIGIRP